MQTDWRSFLVDSGAEFDDGCVSHYGNPDQEYSIVLTGNILCDLSHYGVIAVSGEDATSFLHSQLINDINNLQASASQLNGYCNPKGRLIANFRVFNVNDTWYLRLPYELVDTLIKRLSMFVLRSNVELTDASERFVRIGYSGMDADKELADVLAKIPLEPDQVVHQDNLTVIRIPGITPSFELYSDSDTIQGIWSRLDVRGAPVGTHAWDLIEVLAGIPHVTTPTTEQFVPQMLNYQAIGGLSFSKGCYPGQEIVARMHYLGKLKKRMYLASIKSDEPPVAGQMLASSNQQTGTNTGQILNVAQHPDGYYVVLAVIQIKDAENDTIHLEDANGPVLEIQELPYPVELKS
ncbi:MAG: folate-binding protein [Gammaproteobacteria bacterium]|nr:MAG: folate-binding protein [Gammaproteobacteria bacterium]